MCEICSKLTIKTLEQLLLALDRFHTLFWCFHCWLWIIKCRLASSQKAAFIKKFLNSSRFFLLNNAFPLIGKALELKTLITGVQFTSCTRGLFHKNSNIYRILAKSSAHTYPAGIYLLKANNRNTRIRCEICSKLTIKTLTSNIFYTLF